MRLRRLRFALEVLWVFLQKPHAGKHHFRRRLPAQFYLDPQTLRLDAPHSSPFWVYVTDEECWRYLRVHLGLRALDGELEDILCGFRPERYERREVTP